jgi:hypothetical protein
MVNEYLVVSFPRTRRLFLNGQFNGTTNTILELEGGQYQVTLGPPKNFMPEKYDIDLRGTSLMNPMIVEFKVLKL